MIGRAREAAAASAILTGGRHLLLEGPVGSGKTTLAAEVCRRLGRETIRVDGDDRFSESRLAGWFDPPLVLRLGYRDESFVAGPLVRAMREGRVLFLNELNRLPESAQNLLLPALDERLIQVPHLDRCRPPRGSRWWPRRIRRSTWRPGTSRRRCATGSSTWRWSTRARPRRRTSSRPRPGAPTPGSCARPCAWCEAPGCTRSSVAARPCAARSPCSTWPQNEGGRAALGRAPRRGRDRAGQPRGTARRGRCAR